MQVSLDDVISVLFYIYKVPVLVICFVYKRIGNNRATYNAVLFKLCSMKYAVLILPHLKKKINSRVLNVVNIMMLKGVWLLY